MIWIYENFLKNTEIEELLHMNLKGFNHISNENTKPIMSDTKMSYRICSIDIYKPIYDKLNLLHNLNLSEKTHFLNMQYKKFEEGDHYALHAEDPKIYGDWNYTLYLTDEIDGELVFPSKEDAKKEWSKGFQEMCDQFDVTFKEHTQIHTPRVNTCVVMKTGLAHLVRPCSGSRLTISGWPQFKSIIWYYKTSVSSSKIHGKGRFAEEPIKKGSLVLHINGNIYKNENNSYVNHDLNNNIDWDNTNGWIANRFINQGEEITMNYKQWIKEELTF